MSTIGIMAGLIPAAIGAILVFAAFRSRAANRRFDATAATVSGTLLAIRVETSSFIDDNGITQDTTTRVADVVFRTEAGQEIHASAAADATIAATPPGTPVLLRYDPAKPASIRLGAEPTPSSGPMILGFLALLLIATGVAFALLF